MALPPELFAFLEDLKVNNNREWFTANKSRYEHDLKDPLLRFIEAFAEPLQGISPHYKAVPKVGGSLFRIYRDVRFSKDKSPYKTHAGVHFRHEAGKGAHAPGFYLHLEPAECFAAMGIWGPDTKTLSAIRQAIVDDTDEWQAVCSGLPGSFSHMEDNKLKRIPRGFDAAHPCADDLRRRHFAVVSPLGRQDTLEPDFADQLASTYQDGAAYMRFLTEAIGLPW